MEDDPLDLFMREISKDVDRLDKHMNKKRVRGSEMDIARQKGLEQTISTENKGFRMLEKLGFKEGMGLGKKGTGRVEPVGVSVKLDRRGIGEKTVFIDNLHAIWERYIYELNLSSKIFYNR